MENELLVKILARQDAAFLPCRTWFSDQGFANAVQDRRRAHFAAGTPWRTGARNESLRKHTERELERVERDGLVITHKREGRILGVRLTDAGEQNIRAVIGFPSLAVTLRLVRELAAMVQDGRCWAGQWVPETWLAGVFPDFLAGWRQKLSELQHDFLPACARGWAAGDTDSDGHSFYKIGRPVDAKPLRVLPKADRAAGLLYSDAIGAEIEILKRAKPEHPGNVVIGLPRSWPGEAWPTNAEFLAQIKNQNKEAATSGNKESQTQ